MVILQKLSNIDNKLININIPNNNFEERKYILDVFFDQFLDIQFSVKTKDIKHYEINLGRNRKIIIEDHFFNLFPNDLEYLSVNNIPQKINFFKINLLLKKIYQSSSEIQDWK